ncbi:MAG: hypothetical protein QF511_01610 [Rhodospirillales bacterium]|jgi:hypothetical protein|nr:hypothetical protein [Rhodospirillales bacterium]HJP53898.1 hypothetical protein [Rhodospirillales bacterium]|tara:strand:+ start:254 stop:898 length:645 start_codon:yes stop_codon:yes gene_type:complete
MKQPSLKYVGDKRIRNLLARYACPVPFHAVRTRLLGNIATPRLDASPVQTVKDLWGGELPEFDDMDAVNLLFQDLMSLWNSLAKHQSRSKPFKLSREGMGSSDDDLRRLCEVRTEELEGFIDGLFGADEDVDLLERAVEGMEQIGEINAMIRGVLDLLDRPAMPPATDKERAATLKNVKNLSRIAEKEIHAVILSCKRARAQSIPQSGPPPTFH